jgi:hypothetical protein
MKEKGQVTIFIVIAIVLLVAVGIYFFFLSESGMDLGGSEGDFENHNSLLASCLEDVIDDTIQEMSAQGGFLDNDFNRTFKFTEEDEQHDVAFLCYTREFYVPCVNQKPMLLSKLEEELKKNIEEEVKECVDEVGKDYEKKGYDVGVNYDGFDVELVPSAISLNVKAEIVLTKDETARLNDFNVLLKNKLYDNAVVAQQIIFQNAKFCNFDYIGYMLTYPEFEVDYFRTSDGIRIYTIKHLDSEEWFRLAVRTCVIPQGI